MQSSCILCRFRNHFHCKGALRQRLGSRWIDLSQVDLPKNQRSGLDKAIRILRNIDGIGHVELDEEDVVRHRVVKAIIRAYDREREKQDNHG